jgi:hypothetical protein
LAKTFEKPILGCAKTGRIGRRLLGKVGIGRNLVVIAKVLSLGRLDHGSAERHGRASK